MKKLLYIGALVVCFAACKEEEKPLGKGVLTVETLSVTNLTDTSAVCWGRITNEGGNGISEYGIEFYDQKLNKIVLLPATLEQADSFAVQLGGLYSGSTQGYQAYAFDGNGTKRSGKQQGFITFMRPYIYLYTNPTITDTSLAVRFTPQEEWQEWGMHYSSLDTATSSDPQVKSSSQDTVLILGLQPNTRYFLLPYVMGKNQLTRYYEYPLVASTKCAAPQLRMSEVSGITTSSATASFEVSYTGGGDITASEVKYSVDGEAWSSTAATYSEGQIDVLLSSLLPAKRYKVFASARNKDAVSVSDTLEFATLGGIPALSVPTVSQLLSYRVSVGGSVATDSLVPVTEYGICWSTTSGQAVVSGSDYAKVTGGTKESFSYTTYGFQPNMQYYIRAYAKNQVGIGYGPELALTVPLPQYDSITDSRDSKKYKTLAIGSQVWMAQDLDYAGYAYNKATADGYTTRVYAFDPNQPAPIPSFSLIAQTCPSGWRIASQADFTALNAEVGGNFSRVLATGANTTGLGLQKHRASESYTRYWTSNTTWNAGIFIGFYMITLGNAPSYNDAYIGSENYFPIRCVQN